MAATTVLGEAHGARRREGFTLLELVIAVTILAAFILPMMYIITDSKVRAYKYTQARQVYSLAMQKLHERIHYFEEEDSGTFEAEGHPSWTWEIDPLDESKIVEREEPVLLEYTIRVTVPFVLGESESSGTNDAQGSVYEYTIQEFAGERWYEEQQYLYDTGQYSPLYGSANGTYPPGSY